LGRGHKDFPISGVSGISKMIREKHKKTQYLAFILKTQHRQGSGFILIMPEHENLLKKEQGGTISKDSGKGKRIQVREFYTGGWGSQKKEKRRLGEKFKQPSLKARKQKAWKKKRRRKSKAAPTRRRLISQKNYNEGKRKKSYKGTAQRGKEGSEAACL